MRTVHNLEKTRERRKALRNGATPQEIILWSRLKARGMGAKFRRQHGIGVYIVDFYCPEKKLIVELDGYQHGEERVETYDEARTNYLQKLGYTVLRNCLKSYHGIYD
jgi:very-short-patch-repair endonuclease